MQKGLAFSEFLSDYGTEEQCKAAVYHARWPSGFGCLVCNDARATQFMRGRTRYWQCCACGHQTTLVAGTMMQHTRLPMMKWFLAMYLVTQSKTNIAALALRRQVGVPWKTVWLLKHKLMDTMRQVEENTPLRGDIRVDEAYMGGERNGGKPGRGSENKTAFVVAVEMKDDRPQCVRFDVVAGFSFQALRPRASRALVPSSDIIPDGLLGFEIVRQYGCSHQVVISPKGKAGTEVNAFKWLNVVLGNLKPLHVK